MTTALPEDLVAFEWIARSDKPLIVCDVDEVVLEFVTPFSAFLEAADYRLDPRSFRLHGNVLSKRDGKPADWQAVSAMMERFFAEQADWQTPVDGAAESLTRLKGLADVIFMTAMPPVHFASRRKLLDRHALPYPMIATENPKGDVLKLIHGERQTKVVFIDDIFTNLHSVRESLPNAMLVNLMANETFRALAPNPGDAVIKPADWQEAADAIEAFLDD